MREPDSYIDPIDPINDSLKVFIDLVAYILYEETVFANVSKLHPRLLSLERTISRPRHQS